ncbi:MULTISPECIES: hypothetical protein [Kosakonia]|uniref:hypothetical protein n=1 Tax=Kosakonia TaxID=1330547 RepID=UPI001D07AC1F|nr:MULTISPECIES: hypothetical protein [Kosakonia]
MKLMQHGKPDNVFSQDMKHHATAFITLRGGQVRPVNTLYDECIKWPIFEHRYCCYFEINMNTFSAITSGVQMASGYRLILWSPLMRNNMRVSSIIGATLLATSFHAAAFVSKSPVPVGQKVNITSISYGGHAIPSEAANGGVTQIIPIQGCNCAFCTALRGAMS